MKKTNIKGEVNSMFLNVNHAEAAPSGKKEFEPIAEGKYQAIIKEAEVKQSSSGNDMIKVTLVIRDDVRQQFARRKLWDYIVDSPKAKWKLQQVAKAIEIPEGTNISTIQDFAKLILFKPVTIEIKHEQDTYNGETKTKERIKLYSQAEFASESAGADPFSAPNQSSSNIPF